MDRAGNVFRGYSYLLGAGKRREELDRQTYDMSQRLKLAEMVAAEGNWLVADLGSEHGGMSYALKECGLEAVSVEYDGPRCKNELKKVNPGNVVRCDAFHPPFRADSPSKPEAAVSYMFLGWFVPEELAKDRDLAGIFAELPFSKIYSAELQFEYSSWFAGPDELKRAVKDGRPKGWSRGMELLEPREIRTDLEWALPGWDVEYMGTFGARPLYGKLHDRLGFRFTKKARHGQGQ